MKKWMFRTTIWICMAAAIAVAIGFFGYKRLMDDVQIIQYFDSSADNLDWQTVYIRAVVPENEYKEEWTLNAVRLYVIIRSRNIPNRIDIMIYSNMDEMKECKEYAEASFKK